MCSLDGLWHLLRCMFSSNARRPDQRMEENSPNIVRWIDRNLVQEYTYPAKATKKAYKN